MDISDIRLARMDTSGRKPANMSFPDWVDLQIRDAEQQGAFDNLPGAGKPIPGLDRQQNEMEWIANYLRRENVDIADALPPALRLAKDVETFYERLAEIPTDEKVRAVIEDLNQRIDEAYAKPQLGPPLRVKKIPLDATLARWSELRPELPAPPEPTPDATPPQRRWRLRRQRAPKSPSEP
jgi:DnaJ-like protein